MAKQDINLGTQPTGVGGDTNRSANLKTNANLKELYVALGGSASGGNGSVLPASGLPIANGGTGATTAAAARTNLGLSSAAITPITASNSDKIGGRLIKVGDYGLGVPKGISTSTGDMNTIYDAGEYSAANGTVSNAPNGASGAYISIQEYSPGSSFTRQDWKNLINQLHFFRSQINESTWTVWGYYLTSLNTTRDANGFIKAASPICELYADRIELNDEAKQQTITFEKLGVGDYLIKGSSGLAQSGWYVEQPKDANGNIYHAIIYEQLESGDISVKTYDQKLDGVKIIADLDKPVDVKEGRFISIRLQELPQPEFEEPQADPTLTDYQGSPAPSRLHELVDGTWTISGENAAILENERLAAMPALTRRQFRMVLVMNGFDLADIEALINTIEDPMQRQITMIEWQDATTFHRTNPSLIVMAGLMGLDAETVDQLWLQASTL